MYFHHVGVFFSGLCITKCNSTIIFIIFGNEYMIENTYLNTFLNIIITIAFIELF